MFAHVLIHFYMKVTSEEKSNGDHNKFSTKFHFRSLSSFTPIIYIRSQNSFIFLKVKYLVA